MDRITGWVWLEASWTFYAIAFYWRENIHYFIRLKDVDLIIGFLLFSTL